jgi:uncharacterized membrane protein
MENLIPFIRLFHILGLALLLGGFICSIILAIGLKTTHDSALIARRSLHLVAAPGLVLLLITGLWQSLIYSFDHFKGAGYMHVKITLVAFMLVILVIDMRTQKRLLREHNPKSAKTLMNQGLAYGSSLCGLTILIMWLMNFRPF